MSESRVVLRQVGEPGDLGWMVQAHGEMYATEFGWDTSFEALVARIVADFAADPGAQRQRGWIAELDGRRVGCVLCVPGRRGHGSAQDPAGRSRRAGRRHRRDAGRRVRRVRARGRLRTDAAVDERSARGRQAHLPVPRVHAGRGGTAPQLRRRPDRADLRTRPGPVTASPQACRGEPEIEGIASWRTDGAVDLLRCSVST